MGRFRAILLTIVLLLPTAGPGLRAGADDESERLSALVARALESGDRALLASLFPTDRKVKVSLSQIAELKGFVGSGPLVEAFHRYLSSRSAVRFETEPAARDDAHQTRVRGLLKSRCSGGKRERIVLTFVFERIGGVEKTVEVRESG